jgi:hypothetical protein
MDMRKGGAVDLRRGRPYQVYKAELLIRHLPSPTEESATGNKQKLQQIRIPR